MDILSSLLTAGGLGLGAGVNAYATLLVFGLFARLRPTFFESETAQFFASTPVLSVIGALYVVEFLADKFPTVDHAWDVIHTIIRPVAGAVVAFGAASGEVPPGMLVLATTIGGGAALGAHATKATIRAASTALTGGLANPVISVIEDVFAFVNALAVILVPIAAVGFAILAVLILLRARRQTAPN